MLITTHAHTLLDTHVEQGTTWPLALTPPCQQRQACSELLHGTSGIRTRWPEYAKILTIGVICAVSWSFHEGVPWTDSACGCLHHGQKRLEFTSSTLNNDAAQRWDCSMHLSYLVRSIFEYFAFKCSGEKTQRKWGKLVGKVGIKLGKWKMAPNTEKMTNVFVLQVPFYPWLRQWLRTFLEGTRFHKKNMCWKYNTLHNGGSEGGKNGEWEIGKSSNVIFPESGKKVGKVMASLSHNSLSAAAS